MNLQDLIKTDIDTNGIKQNWLADKLGVTPQTINNILNGNKVSNRTLRAIADHYGIELRKVVELNDNQPL